MAAQKLDWNKHTTRTITQLRIIPRGSLTDRPCVWKEWFSNRVDFAHIERYFFAVRRLLKLFQMTQRVLCEVVDCQQQPSVELCQVPRNRVRRRNFVVVGRWRRQRHAEVWSRAHQSTALRVALGGRSPMGAVPYKLRGTVHPSLRHRSTWRTAAFTPQTYRSSAAPAVRRLPSAVRTTTPAFHVRSPSLFCGWPGDLELVTRLSSRFDTFYWQFSLWSEHFSFLVLSESSRLCAV